MINCFGMLLHCKSECQNSNWRWRRCEDLTKHMAGFNAHEKWDAVKWQYLGKAQGNVCFSQGNRKLANSSSNQNLQVPFLPLVSGARILYVLLPLWSLKSSLAVITCILRAETTRRTAKLNVLLLDIGIFTTSTW
jgi:hypothetical protein